MRNKELVLRRLQKLQGLLKKLDMNVHRGGDRTTINSNQREINELVQDITDLIERES
jgi:hypothetical protein|tara:strand:+ start:293 stop:463 length:171 start_codon:yes stop_codon:yes gene_type:complete